jgi:hypothetical protein
MEQRDILMEVGGGYLLIYVPLKNFSLIWRCHHYRWRAAKFRPLSREGSLSCRTCSDTGPQIFQSQKDRPNFNRLLRLRRERGLSILTRILMGPHSVASYDMQGDAEKWEPILSWILTGSSGILFSEVMIIRSLCYHSTHWAAWMNHGFILERSSEIFAHEPLHQKSKHTGVLS